MEAPRSHSQDTAYELLHTVDPGTEIPRPLLVDLNRSRILQPLQSMSAHTDFFFPTVVTAYHSESNANHTDV